MSENPKRELSKWDRARIFMGVPMAVLALLFMIFEDGHGNLTGISEKALPYVILITLMGTSFVALVLFSRLPKAMSVPLGIAGWIMAGIILLYWSSRIGQGAH